MWLVALDATDVIRLVPIDGTAQDVPVSSLRKVIFTSDSVVFVPASEELPNAVYKYDYSSMLFLGSGGLGTENTKSPEHPESTKFIRDGRLYIRHENKIYDVWGLPTTIKNYEL